MTNAILRGKPDAGNPHVRFDEGEVASAKPRRGSLLYKKVTIEQVKEAESKLKPCPFCGSRVSIEVCDCEGNTQGDDYLLDPWSGLSFSVLHNEYDCILGGELEMLSDSLDDLVDSWNTRYD